MAEERLDRIPERESQKKPERRDVVRTKRSIENAYLELLFERGDGKITVNNILERADVSRGTFYAHYRDISDLAEKVEERVVEQWKEVVGKSSLPQIIENPQREVDAFLAIFESHRDSLRKILKNDGSLYLVRKFKHIIHNGIFSNPQIYSSQELNPDMLSLAGYCFAGILVDTCIRWICSDSPVPRENLVQFLCFTISGAVEKLDEEKGKGNLQHFLVQPETPEIPGRDMGDGKAGEI